MHHSATIWAEGEEVLIHNHGINSAEAMHWKQADYLARSMRLMALGRIPSPEAIDTNLMVVSGDGLILLQWAGGIFLEMSPSNAIQIANPHWNDRYCLWPDKALASRAAGLKRACERGALIMPMHLGAPYCGYVRRQGEGYAFEPAT